MQIQFCCVVLFYFFFFEISYHQGVGGKVSSNKNQPGIDVIFPIRMWNSFCVKSVDNLYHLMSSAKSVRSSDTHWVPSTVSPQFHPEAETRALLLISLGTASSSSQSCSSCPSSLSYGELFALQCQMAHPFASLLMELTHHWLH